MPAKKRNVEGTDGIAPSKPKKGKKPKPYKMPPPLPKGEIFTALDKSQWKTDVSVGKGGFGEIYSTGIDDDEQKYVTLPSVRPAASVT